MVLEVNGSVSVGGYVTQNPDEFEVGQTMFAKAVSLYFDDIRQRNEQVGLVVLTESARE